MNSAWIGPILATVGAFLLAIEMILIRKATVYGKSFDGVLASVWINVIVFIPILLYLIIFQNIELQFTRLSIVAFVLSSLIGTVLGRMVFYQSTKKIGASLTAPISQANLLIATLFGIIILNETITQGHLVGILVLLSGVIMVSYEINKDHQGHGLKLDPVLFLPLATMLFFGLSAPLFRMGLQEGTALMAGFSLKAIAALLSVVAFSLYKGFSPLRPFTGSKKKTFLTAGVAQTFGFFLGFTGLYFSEVVIIAPFHNIQPFFVLLLSFFFLKDLEKITSKIVLGAALIIAGAVTIGIFM